MPPSRRLVRAVLASGVPARTRWSLLATAMRRRLAPRPVYAVRYGAGRLPLSHEDYAVDWETLKSVVVDGLYGLDYGGAVVVDIGAHKGYFGAFALEGGARAVVSYEPESTNFAFLRRCAAPYLARGTDWRVRQAAVGAARGEAELHVMSASWGHALAPPADWAEYEVATERVEVVAMADVLVEAASLAGEATPVVVKVNAEGAECSAILGTPPAAWRGVAHVLVATHPWADCGVMELSEHLADAGLVGATRGDAGHVLAVGR